MKNNKTFIPISGEIITLIRDMLLSDNNNITLKDIFEIERFLNILDFTQYQTLIEDIKGDEYLLILSKLTKKCLENNTTSKTIALQSMLNESKYKDRFQIIYNNRREISNSEVIYIKKFMNDHVSAVYIFQNNKNLIDLSSKISSGSYESVNDIVTEYRDFIFSNYKDLTKYKSKTEDEELDAGLDDESLMTLASETIKELSTKGYYLNTGLLNFDLALGGGLKRSALTLFGAKTSGFKSGMMLNLACSIKLFSKGIETFDKTKKPCIIYLSLENTQTETFKRAFTYATGMTPSQMKDLEPKELVNKFKQSLQTKYSDDDVELKLLYKKSNTIDINHIYSIISDFENDGYEIVALFVDYLATMNSTRYVSKDLQTTSLAMADVSSELYNLAINKKIAVVSGYQLNRSAYYDDQNQTTGKNTLKFTGESFKLTTYADNIFVINKSRVAYLDSAGNRKIKHYLRFDEAKQRSTENSDKGYFYEVFLDDNKFRLQHSKIDKYDFELLDSQIKEEEAQKESTVKQVYNKPSYNNNNYQQNYNRQSNRNETISLQNIPNNDEFYW